MVVVYTSVDDVFARPICERFQKETGITTKLVPDTEETKSAGLLNRLIAEKNRPQADVFWSGDPAPAAGGFMQLTVLSRVADGGEPGGLFRPALAQVGHLRSRAGEPI